MTKAFVDLLREARALVSAGRLADPVEAATARRLARDIDEAIARCEGGPPTMDLVSLVCHDLKDPLASVVMGAAYLQKTLVSDDDGEALRVVDAIARSADRLGRVISDFHDLAKVEAGRLLLETRACAIARVLAGTIDGLSSHAGERRVQLVFEAPGGAAVAVCDPARLAQAISNLVSNAIRFTEAGGRVVVRAEADEKWIRVVVSDTGRGIPAERLARIFDRTANSIGTPRDGPGLGLAIVKGLVELQGGAVTVTSQVGEGTAFVVTLPRAP
jgi:signal transduction histidine kinase